MHVLYSYELMQTNTLTCYGAETYFEQEIKIYNSFGLKITKCVQQQKFSMEGDAECIFRHISAKIRSKTTENVRYFYVLYLNTAF